MKTTIWSIVLPAVMCGAPLFAAESPDEKDVIAVVQQFFDAMAARDSDAAAAVLIPDGRIVAIRENGAASSGTQEQFAARLTTINEPILERMWNPKVLIDRRKEGGVAMLWAEYDFHRDGKFSHCGVDSFSLVKSPKGWKIAGIVYTIQMAGCAPSPLAPPPQK